MNNSSITDWIQAIMVTIGIAFGLYQFVLNDRSVENQKKKTVSELIVSGQNEQIVAANEIIMKRLAANNYSFSKEEITQFMISTSPLNDYYHSWAFCYSEELCNQELAKDYICSNFLVYNAFYEKFKNKEGGVHSKPYYGKFLKVCSNELRDDELIRYIYQKTNNSH